MTDLSEISGLPIKLNQQTHQISLGPQMRDPLYGTREIDAMRPVLLAENCEGPQVVYTMYRNTGLDGDEHLLAKHRLRFDITVFAAGMLGREYVKTVGHYHPPARAEGIAYPEVYEVLSGEALYLLQKVDDYKAVPAEIQVEDVIAVRGRPGDKVIMPPDYGHVTVSTLDVPLVMCNWVCDDFSSYYQSVEEARGFAYYRVRENNQGQWIINDNYAKAIPQVREARPQPVPEIGLKSGVPMYISCRENPQLFAFIVRPFDYEEIMGQGLRIL